MQGTIGAEGVPKILDGRAHVLALHCLMCSHPCEARGGKGHRMYPPNENLRLSTGWGVHFEEATSAGISCNRSPSGGVLDQYAATHRIHPEGMQAGAVG